MHPSTGQCPIGIRGENRTDSEAFGMGSGIVSVLVVDSRELWSSLLMLMDGFDKGRA